MSQLYSDEGVRFMRLPELIYVTGKKRSTIYRDIKLGCFPKQVKLGSGRAVGWLSSEVYQWVSEQCRP